MVSQKVKRICSEYPFADDKPSLNEEEGDVSRAPMDEKQSYMSLYENYVKKTSHSPWPSFLEKSFSSSQVKSLVVASDFLPSYSLSTQSLHRYTALLACAILFIQSVVISCPTFHQLITWGKCKNLHVGVPGYRPLRVISTHFSSARNRFCNHFPSKHI